MKEWEGEVWGRSGSQLLSCKVLLPRVGSLHYLCSVCGETETQSLYPVSRTVTVRRRQERHRTRQEEGQYRPESLYGGQESSGYGRPGHRRQRPQSLYGTQETSIYGRQRPVSLYGTPEAIETTKIKRICIQRSRSAWDNRNIQRSRSSHQDHVYESLHTETKSHMRTLDVRIKLTEDVIRESGDFETGGRRDCSLYDRVSVRDRDSLTTCRDSLSLTSGHSQDSLHQDMETDRDRMDDSWEQEYQSSSMLSRAKVFQQKLTRKCLNKVSSLSLFR